MICTMLVLFTGKNTYQVRTNQFVVVFYTNQSSANVGTVYCCTRGSSKTSRSTAAIFIFYQLRTASARGSALTTASAHQDSTLSAAPIFASEVCPLAPIPKL